MCLWLSKISCRFCFCFSSKAAFKVKPVWLWKGENSGVLFEVFHCNFMPARAAKMMQVVTLKYFWYERVARAETKKWHFWGRYYRTAWTLQPKTIRKYFERTRPPTKNYRAAPPPHPPKGPGPWINFFYVDRSCSNFFSWILACRNFFFLLWAHPPPPITFLMVRPLAFIFCFRTCVLLFCNW